VLSYLGHAMYLHRMFSCALLFYLARRAQLALSHLEVVISVFDVASLFRQTPGYTVQ
jgi:hypothetical protein